MAAILQSNSSSSDWSWTFSDQSLVDDDDDDGSIEDWHTAIDELGGDSPLSPFERLIATHSPILESLLLQLPTSAIIQLHHSSRFLRSFLQSCPTAWRYLSFRNAQLPGQQVQQHLLLPLPPPAAVPHGQNSPSDHTPTKKPQRWKLYTFDMLLQTVVVPIATRLKSLDLDNTAVSGYTLTSVILPQREETLEHLSVRGCKNVSLKYHINPFLMQHVNVARLNRASTPMGQTGNLRLKSLYAYRCRHHRRRPYLPASLVRRDSDSEPTHDFVSICHGLGIWTDTAWCPTPGGRCQRRKDYFVGRAIGAAPEVWVVFDRLWRSANTIGPSSTVSPTADLKDGRLWEQDEIGYEGEALGTGEGMYQGEGKEVPTHLRRSHLTFVENIKCDVCGVRIPERCEQCSVRMHCMGCRKTFCASCAFDRPLPKRRKKFHPTPNAATASSSTNGVPSASMQPVRRRKDRFWWAPGATRSPNLLAEVSDDEGHLAADAANTTFPNLHRSRPPNLKLKWCCLEPMFSGGGGIAFVGPGIGGQGAERIRTVPLPRRNGWEDEDFRESALSCGSDSQSTAQRSSQLDISHFLGQQSIDLQQRTSPRSLCQECIASKEWKIECKGCNAALCKEHDLRGLKMRVCGLRDLNVERNLLRNPTRLPSRTGEETSNLEEVLRKGEERVLELLRDFLWALNDSNSTLELASLMRLPESDDTDLIDSAHPSSMEDTTDASASSNSASKRLSQVSSLGPTTQLRRRADASRRWKGCGSYFCLQYRPPGDSRPRCVAEMKECEGCGILVCLVRLFSFGCLLPRLLTTDVQDCLKAAPPCDCSYCRENYHCPTCFFRLGRGVCRKILETAERFLARKQAEQSRLADLKARKVADEAAGRLGDFFMGLEMSGVENGTGDGESL
ncbi:MAG: hypothetical protein M1819_005244 [Sarea resinae]|nr:MAG: hypothetical protein M1819_005244 [Sarea resinae]